MPLPPLPYNIRIGWPDNLPPSRSFFSMQSVKICCFKTFWVRIFHDEHLVIILGIGLWALIYVFIVYVALN